MPICFVLRSWSLWKPACYSYSPFLSRYHLNDVIIGKIYFLLVRIKIKNMELEIRRRESTGSGSNTYVETETLAKFELMDGAPVRGMIVILLPLFHFSNSKCLACALKFRQCSECFLLCCEVFMSILELMAALFFTCTYLNFKVKKVPKYLNL